MRAAVAGGGGFILVASDTLAKETLPRGTLPKETLCRGTPAKETLSSGTLGKACRRRHPREMLGETF
jgi:hypothetical protein